MKKFWQLVSRKDLIFGIVLFALVLGYSAIESINKVRVEFGSDSVDILAAKYSMTIPYDMVDSAALVEMPDPGEIVEGRDDMTIRFGTWINDTWGEYSVCADLATSKAIVVFLEDGRTFVFSRRSNDTTAELYDTLLTHIN